MLPLDPEYKKMLHLKDNDDPSSRIVIPNISGLVRVKIAKVVDLPAKDTNSSLVYPQIIFKHPSQFFSEIIPAERYSDPYVKVVLGASSFDSVTHKKTTNPIFNLTCDFPVECWKDQYLGIEFFDKDNNTGDDLMGSIRAEIKDILPGPAQELWRGISATSAKALVSYQWINQKPPGQGREVEDGLLSFSCLGVKSTERCMPNITLKLPEKKSSDGGQYMSNREWKAIIAFKEMKEFKLCEVTQDNWDLFQLQGGTLRILGGDDVLLVEVVDFLEREDEVGYRRWLGDITLLQIREAKDKPITLNLKKNFMKKQHFANKLVKKVVKGLHKLYIEPTAQLVSKSEEIMEIKLQFSLSIDC